MSTVVADASVGLLEEIINHEASGSMTRETADYLLTLKLPQHALAKMNELLARNRTGSGLSQEESEELDQLINLSYLFASLHSKARRAIKKANSE